MPAGKLLVSPAAYLSVNDLKADPTLDLTDRNGVAIPDAQLAEMLEEAAGEIDAVCGQSWLARERTYRVHGDGTSRLRLPDAPLIALRQVKIVLPTTSGFDVPLSALLVDYEHGLLENVSPLLFQGIGITTYFPTGTPIDVTYAFGVNFPVAPPTFTVTDVGAIGAGLVAIAPGAHTVQASSVTFNGESLPSPPLAITTTVPTTLLVTITNTPGALKYHLYLDGVLVGEQMAQVLGDGAIAQVVGSGAPAIPVAFDASGARKTPATTDTTPYPLLGDLAALRRATKFLVQQNIWEARNPSNWGIAGMTSGPKAMRFRDNTRSTFASRLDTILTALKWRGVVSS